MTLYTQKTKNIRRTFFLFSIFAITVIGLGSFFSLVFDNYLILYIAITFSVIMNIGAYWYSDKIILSMAGARLITKEEAPELYNIVENLAITAGLPMPKIYLIPEKQPNAFATGRNQKKAVIAVTEGLLEKLDRSELEGVIAHELAHIGNYDMLLSTIVVVLVGFVSILSDLFLRSMLYGNLKSRNNNNNNDSRVQIFLIVLGILFSILAPLAAVLVQLAISRRREFLADACGALLTRYPDGLISALRKISSDPAPMGRLSSTTAHLWLNDPVKGSPKIMWWYKLFMTHPPVEERIAALQGIKVE
jgi:heat shock protein HtpX